MPAPVIALKQGQAVKLLAELDSEAAARLSLPRISWLHRSEFLMWLPVSPLLLRPSRERWKPVKLLGTPRIRGLAVWPGAFSAAIKVAVGRRGTPEGPGPAAHRLRARGPAGLGVPVELPRCGNLVPRSRNLRRRYEVPKCGYQVPRFRHRCLVDLGTARPVKQTVGRKRAMEFQSSAICPLTARGDMETNHTDKELEHSWETTYSVDEGVYYEITLRLQLYYARAIDRFVVVSRLADMTAGRHWNNQGPPDGKFKRYEQALRAYQAAADRYAPSEVRKKVRSDIKRRLKRLKE